jgi:hypothetical protein
MTRTGGRDRMVVVCAFEDDTLVHNMFQSTGKNGMKSLEIVEAGLVYADENE